MKKEEPEGCLIAVLKLLIGKKKKEDSPELEKKGLKSLDKMPYIKRKHLTTTAERNFFRALEPIVRGKYEIFVNVSLGDIFDTTKGLERSEKRSYWNKIKQKHVDFVLCNPKTFEVMLAIELDDSSHATKKAKEKDEFKNKLFQVAGLRLIRVLTQANYDQEELVKKLLGKS